MKSDSRSSNSPLRHLQRPKNRFPLAITLMLLACLFAATQTILVKMASPYFGAKSLVFFRCLVNLIMLYMWVFFAEGKGGVRTLYATRAWKYHLIRSIAGVGAIYCFYYALILMPIETATLLFFTFPIFIPIIARVWLKIVLIHRLWWGIGIAFLGILFILRPGIGLFNARVFIPLLGAILGSTATLSMRALHHTDRPKTIMAYFFTFGVLISGLILILFNDWAKDTFTLYSISIVVLIGVTAALFQTGFSFPFRVSRFIKLVIGTAEIPHSAVGFVKLVIQLM